MWPVEDPQGSHTDAATAARPPMLDHKVTDATWLKIGSEVDFLRRRPLHDGSSSMVLAIPSTPAVATRFLGIIITLVMTVVAMVHLYGRERSIRDRIEMENRLKLQGDADDLRVRANTDVLTGLFNRQKMDEVLAHEIALAKRYQLTLSFVLFDIDHFKAVNDRYGHPMGDRVLMQLSALASRFVRDADVLARWGGEEFVLLAPGTDEAKAHHAAERLRVAIASATFEGVGTMSCSFGVAQYLDGETAEALFARADAALYRAKFGGRNRVESASRLAVADDPLPA
jgi:diguanylate cyclase (GGDEF)-like protein